MTMEMSVLNSLPNDNRSNGAKTRGGNVQDTQFRTSNLDRSLTSELRYDDGGPHREMAIDCPVNFIGMKKEPPRYPRPLSIIQNTTNSIQKEGVTSPRTSVMSQSDDNLNLVKTTKEEQERRERLKRYQEDLQKRREMEDKILREQEFLRTSLRGSKKLQGLEERKAARILAPTTTGIVNPNYLVEEDDEAMVKMPGSISRGRKDVISDHLVIKDILASVEQAQKYLQHPDDQVELNIISQFVLNEKFQQVLKVHNKVVEVALRGVKVPPPSPETAQELRLDTLKTISSCSSSNGAARELSSILNLPHVKNLLIAYDKSIEARIVESSREAPDEDEREYLSDRASQYGENSIKIVRLQKGADPLGATVRNEGDSVIIGRIVKGGAAEKSKMLHEGDEILEINGVDVRGKSINEVCDQMSGLSGILTFLINPNPDSRPSMSSRETNFVHLRAHFNYDPEEDNYIPCRELGISFVKGDILHVINQDDANWWQAYRDGEDDQSLAGLIPSKAFQEQRESIKRMIVGDMKESSKKKHRCNCTHRKNKKKKTLYNANEAHDALINKRSFCAADPDNEEILTYEEVTQYYPQPNRKRPIVLVGPPNVGRQELRQRLMENDFDRFAAAIPHTSRPRKNDELDHHDYHFISRSVFESDIADNRFVEYGEFEKHYFGTSMDAIRQVVNSGKICILNFHPQALPILKSSDLKPYFVFIAPPNIEKLKQLREKQGVHVTDDELKKIIEKAREMEERYGHYFDLIIVNQDLDHAYEELLNEINQLELEPQWVPVQWVT